MVAASAPGGGVCGGGDWPGSPGTPDGALADGPAALADPAPRAPAVVVPADPDGPPPAVLDPGPPAVVPGAAGAGAGIGFVAERAGRTVYGRLGDGPTVAVAALVLALGWLLERRSVNLSRTAPLT